MITFKVKNRRKLFRYEEAAKIETLIQIIPNLSQYSVNDLHPEFNMYELLNQRLSELGSMCFGIEGVSVFGFVVTYEATSGDYCIVLNDYSTSDDWKIALEYVTALASRLGSHVRDGNGKKISAKQWENYDFTAIQERNLATLMGELVDNVGGIRGLHRDVYLGEHLLHLLKHASDKVRVYEAYVRESQYVNAYIHRQTFQYNVGNKTIFGNYSIGENLRVVLPLKPFIEEGNESITIGRPLTHWSMTVSLLDEDGDYQRYKACEYMSFMEQLQPHQYTRVDEWFVVVDPLSREELDTLLACATPLNKHGQFLSDDARA